MTNTIPLARVLRTVALLAIIASAVQAATPATTQAAKPKRGEILRVEKDTITAMPFLPQNERGGPVTYTLDENTRIYLSRLVKEYTNADGKLVRSYRTERASRDDLKVGVVAQVNTDGNRAVHIMLMPDDAEAKQEQK